MFKYATVTHNVQRIKYFLMVLRQSKSYILLKNTTKYYYIWLYYKHNSN